MGKQKLKKQTAEGFIEKVTLLMCIFPTLLIGKILKVASQSKYAPATRLKAAVCCRHPPRIQKSTYGG
jgi:hypothetical protein